METNTNTRHAVAEFFAGFLPMDDMISNEDAVTSFEKDLNYISKDYSTHTLWGYLSDAYEQNKNLSIGEIYTPNRFKLIRDRFEAPNADYAFSDKTTEYGTPYLLISRFLLSLLCMGLLFDFDDNTHYNLIGNVLDTAPNNILHVLSAGAENMMS